MIFFGKTRIHLNEQRFEAVVSCLEATLRAGYTNAEARLRIQVRERASLREPDTRIHLERCFSPAGGPPDCPTRYCSRSARRVCVNPGGR